MLRLFTSPCVRAACSITDLSVQQYSVKYGATIPWRSVQRYNALCIGSSGPVRLIDQQRRQFAESVQHTSRRRQRSNASTSTTTNYQGTKGKAEPDHAFGEYSTEYANRLTFKKTSPQYLDIRYNEDEEINRRDKFKSRTGRRNTPYWYFLQCKKLIKQDQVK